MKHLVLLLCLFGISCFQNSMFGQCMIVGDDMPCEGGSTFYVLNYSTGNGDTIVSTMWSLTKNIGTIVRSTKDSVIYKWTQSDSTKLIAKFITSGGDTFTCTILPIYVKENKIFEINSVNNRKCKADDKNTPVFDFCEGDSTYFYTENDTNFQYKWKLNTTILSSTTFQTEVIHFNTHGTYTIKLTTTNKVTGCIRDTVKYITVHEAPNAGMIVQDTILDSISICRDQRLRFTNTTTPVNDNLYLWQVINTATNSVIYNYSTEVREDFTYIFADSGRYIVRLIAQNCFGCSTSKDFIVKVSNFKIVTIDCPSVVCQDDEKKVMYEAKDTCSTYTWTVIGGTKDTAIGNKLWVIWNTYPSGGFGYVKLHPTDCNGSVCEGETIVEIPVLPTVGQITGQKWFCSLNGENTYEVPLWPGASYTWSITPSNDSTHLSIISGKHSHRVKIKRTDFDDNFKVKVIVSHPLADCFFEKEDTIRVHNISLPNDTICYGTDASFEFDAHGESVDSATWKFLSFNQTKHNSDQVDIGGQYINKPGTSNLYVKVRFNNDDVCFDTAKILIKSRIVTSGISGPTVICLNTNTDYIVPNSNNYRIEVSITNGTLVSVDSVNKRDTITVNWNVSGKNNKILRFRFALGECYSSWDSIVVSDVDSVAQIMTGMQSVCEDSEENYDIQTVPPKTKFRWSVNSAFGRVELSSVDHALINWFKLKIDHDTTVNVTYYDTLCGNHYEINYPVTIHKKRQAEIENTDACEGRDIVFSINVKTQTNYVWDFGDTTIVTTNDTVVHRYKERGFYTVNVRWTDTSNINCVDGFSATKEIEVHRTIKPYIKAYNDSTNMLISCLTIADTLQVRFEANQFNEPDLKYRWYIDNVLQTNDTSYALIRAHPTDFEFTNVFVKLVIDGLLCSDTAYIKIDSCGSGEDSTNYRGCVPLDIVQIKNVQDSSCDIKSVEGQFLQHFASFGNSYGGNPIKAVKGNWLFEDAHPVVIYIDKEDSLKQTHDYEMAGNWLIQLTGNARDSQDTTKICPVSDYRIETVPIVIDFIYTFTCDSNGYNIKLKPQTSFLEGYQPNVYRYIIDDNAAVDATDDVIEIHINNGTSSVCLEADLYGDLVDPIYSCMKCKAVTTPAELLAPEIVVNDTLCEGSVFLFDIEDAEFTDDISGYLWDFGDGTQSEIRRPSHKYAISDTAIYVLLHVMNKWGCESMSSRLVYIKSNTLDGHLTVDSMPCVSHKQLNFIRDTGLVPLTYTWSTTETDSSIIVDATGKYSITVKDRYGCELKLYQDIRVNESFTRGFEGPDSICANESNPLVVFYGDDALFDFFVIAKRISDGHIDTISYSGTNTHFFYFDIVGKSGTYQLIIKAYQNGSEMECDSIIHDIKINQADKPSIQDSLYNCKPYTYVLSESHNYHLDWYSVESQSSFLLDTGTQVSVYKGGTYIGFYKNSHGCVESDTIDIDDQINLRPFLSGCYSVCDTIIDKGTTFIPMLDDTTIYNWWKYKHLDSSSIIKQGTNSRVDSFLLQKKHAGKIYLVVEAKNGCVDSSDLLCLNVDRCVQPVDCDTVSLTCPKIAFIKDTFHCDSMFGYYHVLGNLVVGDQGFSLCTPNPLIIKNLIWVEQPTITVMGNTIHLSGGKLKMQVDSCTGSIDIKVRLCKDGIECIKQLPTYDFECYHNTCGLDYSILSPNFNTGITTLQVKGYVDNKANCGDDYDHIQIDLYNNEECTHQIGHAYVVKTGFHTFLTTFSIPDSSTADCYCLKVSLCNASHECLDECTIPYICHYLGQLISAGGRGGVDHDIDCLEQTVTGYYNYGYEVTFDSTGSGFYVDSLYITDAESLSYTSSEGVCTGSFQIDSTAGTVDFTYFFRNPEHPDRIIAIDSTLDLPPCGPGHYLKSKDVGIKSLKDVDQFLPIKSEAFKSTKLSLIPNPANTSTRISYLLPDKEDGWEISIMNFQGKVFAKKVCCDQKGSFKFDCSSRPAGMYFVVLAKNGKISTSQKLLIIN